MRLLNGFALLVVWLSASCAVADDLASGPDDAVAVVGRFGDLSTLEIQGNEIFSSDEIRQALARDLKLQEACRPSVPLADLVESLEQRLVEGYRYSGCPDAKVSVTPTEEHLVVRVEEGKRFVAGKVHVRGTTKVDERALATSLAGCVKSSWFIPNVTLRQAGKPFGPGAVASGEQVTSQKEKSEKSEYEKTYWTQGKPVQFGGRSTEEMRPRVAEALLRQGYPAATFHLEIEPSDEEDVADLVVDVEDLGPPSTVAEVTIEGLERHTPAELLELMQIAEGESFGIAQLREALDRVHESCRFWGCKVTVDFPSPSPDRTAESEEGATGTRLLIEVVEYPHVSRLGEPLSETDQILQRAALWLDQFHQQEEWGLQGDFAYPAGEAFGGTKGEFWVSPAEGIMLDLRLAGSPPHSDLILDGEYRLIIGPGGVTFADIGHGDWISANFQVSGAPQVGLIEGEVEEGNFKPRFNFSYGISSHKKSSRQLTTVHPLALIDLAHNEGTECEIREGVLWIREKDHLEARFDAATGRLLQLAIGPGEPKGVRVATVPRDLAGWRAREAEVTSYISRWDGDRPLTSLVDYTLDIASRMTKEPSLAASSKRAALRTLVDSKLFAALERFVASNWIDGGPAIPAVAFQIPDSYNGHQDPKYSLAGLPDYLFVRETWPWTLSREASYFVSKHSTDAERRGRKTEFQRVLAREDTGPICYWVLGKVGQTDKYTARRALEMLEEDVFDREIDMLTTPGTGLWEQLEWLVPLAQATTDEEIDKFLSTYTDSFDRPVIQAAQLLRRLDATSELTLRESFANMLRTDLRPLVEADLQKLAAGWGKANRPTLDLSQVIKPFPSESQKPKEEGKSEEPQILSGVLPFEEELAGENKE